MPKTTKKTQDPTPKPKREPKSENHWSKMRSQPKDTSKRINPEELKSLRTARKRVNYNYSESVMGKVGGKVVKKNAKASKNTLEQREKLAKAVAKDKSATVKTVSRRGRKTSEDKKKKAEKEKETKTAKKTVTEEESASEDEEEQPKEEALSKKVLDLAKKLGASPSKQNKERTYRDQDLKLHVPLAIRTFCNMKWPANKRFASNKFDCGGMEINMMDLNERNEYKFLKENKLSAIIANGDIIVATLLSDVSADFEVYLIEDEDKDGFKGPYKISEFLATLDEDNEDYEEGEEMED